MNASAANSRDVALCPPALLMALDGDANARLPPELLQAWRQALHDAQSLAHPVQHTDGTSRRALAPKDARPATQKLNAAEFFVLSAELERVNRDIESSRPLELHERVKKLAVDELDLHMFDTLAPSQRQEGRQVVQLFTAQQYESALPCMLHVVNACATEKRTASMLNNEAVCYFKLERWQLSKQSSERALDLYQDLDVCRRRITRICLAVGDVAAAKREASAFKQSPQWAGEWRAIKAYEAYTALMDSQQYTHALRELDALLVVFPCATFDSLKVQLLSLESTKDAAAHARQAHCRYPFSTELQFWEAELAFHSASTSAELHEVIKTFHAVSAPKTDTRFRLSELRVRSHLSILTRVEELAEEANWDQLVAICSTALEQRHTLHDGMKRALYSARAVAHTHLQSWYAGLDDALRAISYAESASDTAKLLGLASQCEEALLRFKDALEHAQQSHRLAPSPAAAERIRKVQAHFAQHTRSREARRADAQRSTNDPHTSSQPPAASPAPSIRRHYETLGLVEAASSLEVRRAYRALAMRWHPDKWSGAAPHDVAAAEQRFKEVQNAYEVIMNAIAMRT